MPQPEEVPKKTKLFCQNLRRYQKKKKKIQVFKAHRSEDRKILGFFVFWYLFRFWHFLGFFGTSSGFGNKILPKPEEVPKKTKLFCQNLRRYQKKQKKNQVFKAHRSEDRKILGFFGFLVPPQVLAIKSCQNLKRYQKKQNFFAKT